MFDWAIHKEVIKYFYFAIQPYFFTLLPFISFYNFTGLIILLTWHYHFKTIIVRRTASIGNLWHKNDNDMNYVLKMLAYRSIYFLLVFSLSVYHWGLWITFKPFFAPIFFIMNLGTTSDSWFMFIIIAYQWLICTYCYIFIPLWRTYRTYKNKELFEDHYFTDYYKVFDFRLFHIYLMWCYVFTSLAVPPLLGFFI